jgi:protein-tyrosine phosphatase
MIRDAVKMGVTDMILTPHYRFKYKLGKEKLEEEFLNFKKEVASQEFPINLYLGQEIYIDKDYARIFDEKQVLTINGTNYVLLEFYYGREYDIVDAVFELSLRGYKAVIAHFERYSYATISDAESIKKMGGLIQVNASSIVGKDGFDLKKRAKGLFEEGLVDFVASDIHSNRTNYMAKAYKLVSKKYGNELADKVFTENAKEILIKSQANA